jgi:hypothetical protein
MRVTKTTPAAKPLSLSQKHIFFNSPLRPIRILLRIHLLDADFQPALFREAHVLLLHVFLAAVGQVVAPQVDLVAEVGGATDDREEDYEREEGGEAHYVVAVVEY